MGLHIPYNSDIFRPGSDMVAGNSVSDNPVVFHLVPAWGEDLARIKSIVFAITGLASTGDWSGEIQEAVIAAFRTGAPAFVNTIERIEGLTVPSAMAYRAGLIPGLPVTLQDGEMKPDAAAPYTVISGLAFSKLCGAFMVLALHVAMRISTISAEAEKAMDPRFFGQPSGFGGKATGSQGAGSNVATVRRTSKGRGTAGRK